MLPSPNALRQQIERAGLIHENSIEFAKSYSQTLRRWHLTFNDKWDDIHKMGFDNRFRNMWNFYLTSCASAFEFGNCDVTQIAISKPK
jgi:cyclopropane-fatty-acyl-phospholipid synthase